VVVVTLVTGFLTPESKRQEFYQRVRKVSGDAVAHVAQLLRGSDSERNAEVERRIVAGLSKLENAAPLVSAGSIEGYRRLRHVDALVVASLSAIAAGAALRARIQAGEAAGTTVPTDLPERLQRLADQLRAAPSTAVQEMPALALEADDKALGRLARALQQLLASAAALCSANGDADSRSLGAVPQLLAPHREWALARRTVRYHFDHWCKVPEDGTPSLLEQALKKSGGARTREQRADALDQLLHRGRTKRQEHGYRATQRL
jgi:hypothetical protein